MTPFAVYIYQRVQQGETCAQLSRRLGIPVERVEQRVRAAAAYLAFHHKAAA
jgi:hypothetical protein